LRTAVSGDHRDLQSVINPALAALDAVIERRDVSRTQTKATRSPEYSETQQRKEH
jgi:hypothetical protein